MNQRARDAQSARIAGEIHLPKKGQTLREMVPATADKDSKRDQVGGSTERLLAVNWYASQ